MQIEINTNAVLQKLFGNKHYDALNNISKESINATDVYLTVAQKIIERSLEYVPYDTGKLMNSAYIIPFGTGFEIGYTAEYATYVHEIGFNYHEPPTQYKYLEDAAFEVIVEYYNDTGINIPVNIEYTPLRVFVGGDNAPGQRLVTIKNKQKANQNPEVLKQMWDGLNAYNPDTASESEKTYYNKMRDFFNYYHQRGKSSWSVLSEWADRMRHN